MKTCTKEHDAVPRAMLEDLPKSQREPGRHGCPACAFEAGVRHGLQLAARGLAENGAPLGSTVADVAYVEDVVALGLVGGTE